VVWPHPCFIQTPDERGIAQCLRPSDLFGCWPCGLTLSPRFHPGLSAQYRLFQPCSENVFVRSIPPPFPSNRHHWNNGDCLEGKRENYQVCSVQYCVQQLCNSAMHTHMNRLTVLWIGFCFSGPISLCLDSFLCMYYFVSECILHACVVL